MVFTILMLLAISFVVAFLVWKVQKNKAAKAESAEKCCPYHDLHEHEDVVGYETVPPAPAIVVKKKPTKKKAVTKKTATKKANSSQKKK